MPKESDFFHGLLGARIDGSTPLAYSSWAVIIVETRAFSGRIDDLLSQEEYRTLQVHLVRRPDAGDAIPGTGGLRKIRWGSKGRGKRGGCRVIYFWHRVSSRLLMLFAFSKNERADIGPGQKRLLRQIVEAEYR